MLHMCISKVQSLFLKGVLSFTLIHAAEVFYKLINYRFPCRYYSCTEITTSKILSPFLQDGKNECTPFTKTNNWLMLCKLLDMTISWLSSNSSTYSYREGPRFIKSLKRLFHENFLHVLCCRHVVCNNHIEWRHGHAKA